VDRSTSWGTGIEQQNLGFITYSLRSWLIRWEKEIHKTLLTKEERLNYYAEFLVEGLLRGDYKTRQEGLAIQRQNGIINADEWRELENMNEIPDNKGKIYLVNAAMAPADQAGQKPVASPSGDNTAEEGSNNA
jgi:phage portal protein BeeE